MYIIGSFSRHGRANRARHFTMPPVELTDITLLTVELGVKYRAAGESSHLNVEFL